ncbi:MAG: tetratricopeptide repeat protein [Armatimonadetes bacterium]|nr:tetratricopeptide repeat protein [Armatimonadota bacterium]
MPTDEARRDRQGGTMAADTAVLQTDIYRSVHLWEVHGSDFEPALSEHNAIVRRCASRHSGAEYKFTGDGFIFLFPSASDAVACGVAIQEAVQRHTWPGGIASLRVRVAVHRGPLTPVGAEFVGPALNVVSRTLGAAHGGQTLVTAAAADSASMPAPAGVALHNIGLHQLRDVYHPVRLYLALPADQPAPAYVPVRSLSTLPTNLPEEVDEFVGRTAELEALYDRIREGQGRLVTIAGPGGVGKTRFMCRLGQELLDEFDDGVWLVDLSGITDPRRVAPAIASVLHLPVGGEPTAAASLAEAIGSRALCLLLDNFEQVIEAADVPLQIVRHCPKVTCIVSSRERLRVPGEIVHELQPLFVPDADSPLDEQLAADSVRLFNLRAAAARSGAAVAASDRETVPEICRRLGGLPLALELAAARLPGLSCQQLLASLQHQLDVLESSRRGVPDRHRSMRAALEWSTALLTADELRVLTACAVLRGGFFADAAAAVSSDEAEREAERVSRILGELGDKNLLQHDEVLGRIRYWMLPPVREYALERLGRRLEECQERAARHFGGVAKSLEVGARLEDIRVARLEMPNFRLTLEWCRDHGEGSIMIAIMRSVWPLFNMQGASAEGVEWLERATAASRAAGNPAHLAHFLVALATTRKIAGQLAGAAAAIDECLAMCRDAPPELAEALGRQERWAMLERAALLAHLGRVPEAEEAWRSVLSAYEGKGQPNWVAESLRALAQLARRDGRLAEAEQCLLRALDLEHTPNEAWGVSDTLLELGRLRQAQGNLPEALEQMAESIRLCREFADNPGLVRRLVAYAACAQEAGRTEAALEACREALALARRYAPDLVGEAMRLMPQD